MSEAVNKELLEALKKCVGVFNQLADAGNYPLPLFNNGGWYFASQAISKAEAEIKKEEGEKFYIIFPQKRYVSAQQIASWYADACADRRIADEYLHAHDTQTMARGLMDSGMITLAEEPQ